MNRIEFIATIAIVLFIVFALGWFSNWVMGRFMRVSETDIAELDAMGHALHQAEETRDQALQRLQQEKNGLDSHMAGELSGINRHVQRFDLPKFRYHVGCSVTQTRQDLEKDANSHINV